MTANEFETKFNRYTKYLRALALKLTSDPVRAKDLFQETAFRAFKHQDKFKTDVNMRSWLTTIMKNSFINDYRKKLRNKEVSDDSKSQFLLNSMNNSIRNRGEGKIMMDELTKIVDNLDDSVRIPFLMAFKGYKYEEISAEMNLPLGTVKSRIFIARKLLKEKIKVIYNANSSVEVAA